MPLLVGAAYELAMWQDGRLTRHSPEEEINGLALIELQHEELRDLGIVSVGHRLTILKAVYDVKIKHNIQISNEHYVPLCKPVASSY